MVSEHGIAVRINGTLHEITVDVRTTLLDLLRERLGMTGTKKGCDHGLCGACTVAVDGERILSCLALAVSVDRSAVTTIEGIGGSDTLDPVQQAFLDHDGFQCGYCTPGQISSAHALLREHARGDLSAASFDGDRDGSLAGHPVLTEQEIRERMAGNVCRCGAYSNIVDAVAAAAKATSQ
ncbi:(2Fe-2S)-binding protein [Mycolicibacterium rhodesiae]|uniref:(2Fe-2S)-binding protein n=1 Tax=Mycolicibacterium rhodesiae TaxID=36814 RepID=A0A1X0IKB3_MYCRH|nr:2Fe-2S iron-sulfur cluster-binding protein [Mycolicibacterium rhodesiae]MCV7347040.1 2Fe-2S iron-sulfur cluster binding domain-containing protein [Mycolicibacterium rhodesiae]ORB48288.1 (2Fe-2S)-binding protein [Mycolicibacterium rhodesiae]